MSATAQKGAKESELAAVAREAGVEEIVGLTKVQLIRVIVDKLVPRELDADAAVEQHACRLLSACIKIKDRRGGGCSCRGKAFGFSGAVGEAGRVAVEGEVVLQLLHGRRGIRMLDGKESRRKGALDDADKTLLRGLMRRYGWARAVNATARCYWDEVYRSPGYKAFMRTGVRDTVIEMFDQPKEWQESSGLKVMPSEADDKALFGKVETYRHNESKKRSKDMAQNYPIDFEPLQALSLDCLASAGHGVVMWRSEFEKEMLFSLPGWVEDDRKKQTFHTLQEILRSKDEDAL
eukprot:s702_g30.t1